MGVQSYHLVGFSGPLVEDLFCPFLKHRPSKVVLKPMARRCSQGKSAAAAYSFKYFISAPALSMCLLELYV